MAAAGLPLELWVKVFKQIPAREQSQALLACSRVSRNVYRLAHAVAHFLPDAYVVLRVASVDAWLESNRVWGFVADLTLLPDDSGTEKVIASADKLALPHRRMRHVTVLVHAYLRLPLPPHNLRFSS